MKCKQGNSLDFQVKTDNFLQNMPKVSNKLIISDIRPIYNAINRKCFECDFVKDVVKKSFEISLLRISFKDRSLILRVH